MSQVEDQKKYEVKILKQIIHLPIVFMLKHSNGQVTKISLISNHYVNCSKYVSRSGMTFNGCFRNNDCQLEEVKGIYYTPAPSIISIYRRNKITRSLEDMKNIILKELELLNLSSKELLISYTNYAIEIYDYFIKGQLYQFNLTFNQGNLEIYEVPSPNSELNLSLNHVNSLTIYNHEIQFSNTVLATDLFSTPGTTFLVYLQNSTTFVMKSADHGENSVMLSGNKYYLITHPRPKKNKVD
ncbi:hypothetical protein CCL42_gp56 [Sulfolobus islandicus rod-shaped virus 8]|uniref:Uncharacterized protein n=1 Tax=Sulfolobus islandicus rod-shaped virus 8 TaxID=1983551 RepID=A0A1X9SJQ8_9VIRU|nr:hypothetical protein CCL42_gp56 [Sulfolobus islandicus rod-shaped virus 8]ARQ96462.1 hypothetical protein [Sulfolobus islandicus rod-shaped virus 8]